MTLHCISRQGANPRKEYTMVQYTTLRPGFMVAVSTSITGNVSYHVVDQGTQETVEGEEATWTTNRLTRNKDEQKRATKARSLARSAIQTVCSKEKSSACCASRPRRHARRRSPGPADRRGIPTLLPRSPPSMSMSGGPRSALTRREAGSHQQRIAASWTRWRALAT
jgi:hypothetical protein